MFPLHLAPQGEGTGWSAGEAPTPAPGLAVNAFATNPLIGPNDESVGPRFLSLARAYDPDLRAGLPQECGGAGTDEMRSSFGRATPSRTIALPASIAPPWVTGITHRLCGPPGPLNDPRSMMSHGPDPTRRYGRAYGLLLLSPV